MTTTLYYTSLLAEEEIDEQDYWWFGALIYMIGSIMINLGSNLIRRDHANQETSPTKRPPYARPLWLTGFGVFGAGNVLNFVAFMFAAQSLLAALGSIQFVTNIFFANLINKEPIKLRSIIATAIIIVGNIFIVIFGAKGTTNHNLEEVKELAMAPLFIGYVIVLGVLVVALQSTYLLCKQKIKSYSDPHHAPAALRNYLPFAYATVSAIIGTSSIVFGKVCAGLLQQAAHGEEVFQSPWTYVLVVAFVCVMIFWLYRMNHALRLYDAMFIIPVLQCVWLLFGVLGGEIFFQEYKLMSTSHALLFSFGVFVLLTGISVLRPSVGTAVPESVAEEEMEDFDETDDIPAVDVARSV